MGLSSSATGLRPGVCTSTTRPTAPYTGQIIFQTDTGTMHNWDGTTWQFLAPTQQRNLLYNGAMQVAQRGTSTASITATGYYTADRWQHGVETLGTWTSSIENDGPTGSGFRKSLKMLCTTAKASPSGTDNVGIQQNIEGQDLQSIFKGTSAAQQLTLSFWVKSNVTGTYVAELYDFDNTRQVSKSYTISSSGTWEFKTVTFNADTTGAFDNDNAASLLVKFWLGASSYFTSGTLNTSWASSTPANRAVGQVNLASATNNYWQITGVQLNVGSYASPFEFKSYQRELQECQRYYYLHATGSSKAIASGHYYSAAGFEAIFPLPVRMRTTPTLDYVQGTNYYRIYSTAARDTSYIFLDSYSSDTAIAIYDNATSSGTAGYGGIWYTFNAASYVGFKAEL